MASQPKVAKILSKGQQRNSIKGFQKKKKNIIKNTLANPFSLEWPSIRSEHEEEIKLLLHKCCFGLKKIRVKPPWKELKQLKRPVRSTFIKEYKRQFLENLDPDSARLNKETNEALSHLILGYNAVMRALEKDHIAGVLVKKNMQIPFVAKTFLPGCANKCIPLLPLDDLDILLKRDDSLALPHACMVLGLKSSVKEEENRFHALYVKMNEALEIDVTEDSSEEEDVKQSQEVTTVEVKKQKSSHILSKEEIQLYHLKRTHVSKRMFIPRGGEEQDNATVALGSDFIKLGPSEVEPDFNCERKQLFGRKPQKSIKIQAMEKAAKQVMPQISQKEEISSLLMIDEKGDIGVQGEILKDESSGCGGQGSTKKEKRPKKKRKNIDSSAYIPAKTKRLKGNPNRKSNAEK